MPSADVVLSMAVWKAVVGPVRADPGDWDSGRVGAEETERISTLIWGGLDTGGAGGSLAVSLPEACKLSDALASSCGPSWRWSPATPTSPPACGSCAPRSSGSATSSSWSRRLPQRGARRAPTTSIAGSTDLTERDKRGADIGGLIGPLEIDAARAERDLIVGAATRKERAPTVPGHGPCRGELEARRRRSRRSPTRRSPLGHNPAPRLAVPDVTALGPVPNAPAELNAYL